MVALARVSEFKYLLVLAYASFLNEITPFVSVNVLQKEEMVIALSPRPPILLFGTCLL